MDREDRFLLVTDVLTTRMAYNRTSCAPREPRYWIEQVTKLSVLLAIAGAVTVVTTGGVIIVPMQNGRLFESRAIGIVAPSGVIRLSPPLAGHF